MADSLTMQRTEPTGPEAPNTEELSSNVRPDYVPEKFWDPVKGEANLEGLATSYAELEGKLGAPENTKAEEGATDEPGEDDPPTKDEINNILESVGLDAGKFTIELEQNGKLSEASYTELESKGFPKDMVDQYIAGASADANAEDYSNLLAEGDFKEVIDTVEGGEEGFKVLNQWGGDNLTDSQINTYDNMVNSGDKEQAKAAVAWLNKLYVESNGKEPNLLSGDGNNTVTKAGYRSTAEVVAAMRDPRYTRDPAYRADVVAKLAVSDM